MKEMQYKATRQAPIILDEGTIDKFNYKIISFGQYPCAYIEIPVTHRYYKVNYDNINIHCHGGLTYGRMGLVSCDITTGYWIGWDYAHVDDYFEIGLSSLSLGTKKWTTKKILEEVKEVIGELKKC